MGKGHSLFTGLYLLLGRRCPLAPQLDRQEAVCQQEKVPFKSKVTLALEAVRDFAPVPGTQTHVLVDSWYTCRQLWRAVLKRGWAITGGLKANPKLRVQDPTGGWHYLSLAAYAASLSAADFQETAWPHEDGTSRRVYGHLLPTWVKKLGPREVLVVRDRLDQPLKEVRYWATSQREPDLATVVGWAAQRWPSETFFADVKEVFGLDQYQLQSAQSLVRFWHLAFLGYTYLEEQRTRWSVEEEDGPHLTDGQMRREQQRRHRLLLLSWLHSQFRAGLTPRQVDELLAA